MRRRTLPVGLCGVLSTSRRVRGVKAASSSAVSSDQLGGCSWTMLRQAAEQGGCGEERCWGLLLHGMQTEPNTAGHVHVETSRGERWAERLRRLSLTAAQRLLGQPWADRSRTAAQKR